MAYLLVLGDVEVVENGTRGNDTHFKILNAKSLQVDGLKMAQQFVVGCVKSIHPIVELVGIIFGAKKFDE